MTDAITLSTVTTSLDALMCFEAAMVDANTGILLAGAAGGTELEVAAAGDTEIARAKPARTPGLRETIEDAPITMLTQFHIVRPSAGYRKCLSTSSSTAETWPWPG